MLVRRLYSRLFRLRTSTFSSRSYCQSSKSASRTEERAHKASMRQYKVSFDYEYLMGLTKTQLVYKVIRLQRQVDSYTVMKSVTNVDGRDKIRVDHPEPEDVIDHRDYGVRRVAFKVAYLGWDYMAYAWSHNTDRSVKGHTNIVERVFLEALLRLQLVQGIGRRVNIDRCGRTDSGVSGLSQVICANVRSNLNEGYGVWRIRSKGEIEKIQEAAIDPAPISSQQEAGNISKMQEKCYDVKDRGLDEGEIPYITLLNQALPPDIRVLAWSPVERGFSPRRVCKGRTYKYFFPRAALDLDLMNEAAQKLVGTHDFRNFAKISSDNLGITTERTILNFKIEVLSSTPDPNLPEFDICAATITSRGFLYRQVRLMVAILCGIAQGDEDISIIDELLDTKNTQGRPSYNSVAATPLLFYDSVYEDDAIDWRWDPESLCTTAAIMSEIWCENAMKSQVSRAIYQHAVEKLDSEDHDALKSAGFTNLIPFEVVSGGKKVRELDRSSNMEEFVAKERKRAIRKLQRRGRYQDAAEVKSGDKETWVGWKS